MRRRRLCSGWPAGGAKAAAGPAAAAGRRRRRANSISAHACQSACWPHQTSFAHLVSSPTIRAHAPECATRSACAAVPIRHALHDRSSRPPVHQSAPASTTAVAYPDCCGWLPGAHTLLSSLRSCCRHLLAQAAALVAAGSLGHRVDSPTCASIMRVRSAALPLAPCCGGSARAPRILSFAAPPRRPLAPDMSCRRVLGVTLASCIDRARRGRASHRQGCAWSEFARDRSCWVGAVWRCTGWCCGGFGRSPASLRMCNTRSGRGSRACASAATARRRARPRGQERVVQGPDLLGHDRRQRARRARGV